MDPTEHIGYRFVVQFQRVTPVPSTITSDDLHDLMRKAEHHVVPFMDIPVTSFSDDHLREVVARYWSPQVYVDGHDTAFSQILGHVRPSGFLPNRSQGSLVVKVRIILSYPLSQPWEATVNVPANRLGEVFSICYDMYKHIYALDDSGWRADGHMDDAPPRAAASLFNRAQGSHVWGHDMDDLVFEGLWFCVNPELPTYERTFAWARHLRRATSVRGLGRSLRSLLSHARSRRRVLYERISAEAHEDSCPFIGVIFFNIGS